MYVCLCNGTSDRAIREAVRSHQPESIQQLKRLVPIGTKCGKCIHVARQIMEDELQQLPQYEKIA